jgi:hypothetical protein
VVIEHAERAVTLADAEGDRSTRLFARYGLGRALAWQARWNDSVNVFDQAAEIGGGDAAADIEVLGWRPYVECLSIRTAVLSLLGRPHQGLEFAERLPALLRRLGLRSDMSSAATDRIWLCWMLGDAERARAAGTTMRGRSKHDLRAFSRRACVRGDTMNGHERRTRARGAV